MLNCVCMCWQVFSTVWPGAGVRKRVLRDAETIQQFRTATSIHQALLDGVWGVPAHPSLRSFELNHERTLNLLGSVTQYLEGGGGCPPGGNGLGQELEQILYLMIGPAIKVSHGHLWNSMSKCWGVGQKEILCYSLVKPQFISVLRSNFEEAVADERIWLVFKENPSALKNQHFSLQESD